MDWRKIIMDSIVVAIIGLISVVISAIITDYKWYKKISGKIGNSHSDTLEGQHERIKEAIVEKASGIEKVIEKMQHNDISKIFYKVDNIDKEMTASKERYASLNLEQRDIKNSVNKLVNEWEYAIVENKELKDRIKELELKNRELEKQYRELSFKYRKDISREDGIDRYLDR